VSERLATLYQIMQRQCDVVIAPLTTTLYRLAPVEYLAAHTFFLKKGQKLDVEALRGQLTLAGYHHVSQVYSPGEYSVRGGLIDLFPMGSPVPYRLDLFGDEIETIRTFDVDTQRSIYPVNDIRLLPAREFPLDEKGISAFRGRFREAFEGDPSKSRLYKDVSNGIPCGGIEYYLPLFFDATATLFDYLPAEAPLCLHGDLMTATQGFWQDTQSRHRLLSGDRDRPYCRRKPCSCPRTTSSPPSSPTHGSSFLPSTGKTAPAVPCRPCKWTVAPTTPSPACGPFSTASMAGC
jgi:transcription-repair coupling factor (superfamily II helicase)